MTARRPEGRAATKFFFPQEFRCVVAGSPLEFAGWFNNFSVDAPLRPQGRHMTTLRKY
jgi:hypothetical protein